MDNKVPILSVQSSNSLLPTFPPDRELATKTVSSVNKTYGSYKIYSFD